MHRCRGHYLLCDQKPHVVTAVASCRRQTILQSLVRVTSYDQARSVAGTSTSHLACCSVDVTSMVTTPLSAGREGRRAPRAPEAEARAVLRGAPRASLCSASSHPTVTYDAAPFAPAPTPPPPRAPSPRPSSPLRADANSSPQTPSPPRPQVTATTRAKREGEVHGVDYFFVSRRAKRSATPQRAQRIHTHSAAGKPRGANPASCPLPDKPWARLLPVCTLRLEMPSTPDAPLSRPEWEDLMINGELLEHALVYGEYKARSLRPYAPLRRCAL